MFVSFFRFAFQPNPPLQGRAVIVYGCVSKEIDDAKIRQLLLVFIKVNKNIKHVLQVYKMMILQVCKIMEVFAAISIQK